MSEAILLNPDTCIIMPVYNEAKVVGSVIRNLKKHFLHIVCIDDGSKDNSAKEIERHNVTLLRHIINIGQGGALQTGLDYAVKYLPGVKHFVTFDSDGQHSIKDVHTMLGILRKGTYDVTLGSRFLTNNQHMPVAKKVMLKGGVYFTNRLSGIKLTDTHNGLRAFNRKFAKQLQITMSDYSHASEIIDTIARTKVRWIEVPVTIKYYEFDHKKGQSMINSINITFDLLINRLQRKSR